MTRDEAQAAYAALYAPAPAELAGTLPDIGDGLAAALAELARAPSAPACEQMAIRLDGARRHVLKLAEALKRQAAGDGER